jgi:tetratricopeptide (TPR) repeat protein
LGFIVFWAILRTHALGEMSGGGNFPWPTLFQLFLEGWYALGYYTQLLFWPTRLSAFPELPHSLVLGIFALCLFGISLGLAFLAWIRGYWVPLLLIGWWWLSLAPALLISASWPDAPLAERYFYLPSVGGLLLVGYGLGLLWRLWGRPQWITWIVLIPLVPWAYGTMARNQVWQDDLRFWQVTVGQVPDRWFSHQNLALAYSGKGNFQEAEKEFLKALERTERGEEKQKSLTSLGIDALKQKEYEKAERYFIEAQGYNERSPYLQYNLGILYLSDPVTHERSSDPTRLRKALAYFKKAAEYNPYYIKALLSSGSIHRILGDEREARERLQRVLALSRRDGEYVRAARHELALVAFSEANRLTSAGEVEQAIPLYNEALMHDPTFAEGHNMLADRLLGKGRLDEAIMHLQEAIRMRPDFADAHYSRGRALTMRGDIPGAIEAYQAFQKYWKGDPRFLDIARGEVQTLEGRLKGR